MLTKLENESAANQRSDLDIAALIGEIVQDVDLRHGVMSGELPRRHVIHCFERQPGTAPAGAGKPHPQRRPLYRTGHRRGNFSAQAGGRRPQLGTYRVRDQGPGVPESELYDIFRPFYRVNDARERQSGGAGVGLASPIVRYDCTAAVCGPSMHRRWPDHGDGFTLLT